MHLYTALPHKTNKTYLNSSPVSVDIIDKHSWIVKERDPGIIIAFPCMLMLHRSSSTDDIIVDRPNDDRGVRVESLMIYDKGCIVILLFCLFMSSVVSDCDSRGYESRK